MAAWDVSANRKINIMEFRTGPKWDERIIHLEPAKKIGVLISSGVDSTTLFKLLYDNFKDTSIRIFNVQTSDDPEKPVIDAILNQLGLVYFFSPFNFRVGCICFWTP